jgi:erythromycin esterase-like protein
MVDTLGELTRHLERHGGRAKFVLWAHNSHLGDARATQMGRRGELNVGQLVREEHGGDAVLVGFTTDHGTVTAASDWGGPAERKRIRPGLPDSFEGLFNRVEIDRFLLTFGRNSAATRALDGPMLERAIGVIYRPETERFSHYFDARLSKQFDAVLHFNETLAVEPLERTAEWEAGELPETYPFAV